MIYTLVDDHWGQTTMTTWTELERSIRAAGAIDMGAVRDIATTRAKAEMKAWAEMGMLRDWKACFAEEMAMAWCRAQTILDHEIALRIRASLPAAEQLARTADLNATLAETSLPPRKAEAARWRAEAAAVRRSKFRVV